MQFAWTQVQFAVFWLPHVVDQRLEGECDRIRLNDMAIFKIVVFRVKLCFDMQS